MKSFAVRVGRVVEVVVDICYVFVFGYIDPASRYDFHVCEFPLLREKSKKER